MSYESARSTRLLATHCVCCGQPLRDSESVELGIGPVCRTKHGFYENIPPAARKAANVLVHEGACVADNDPGRVIEIAGEIEVLGLTKLAGIIRRRFIFIVLEDATVDEKPVVNVRTPYSPEFNGALRREIPYAAKRVVRDDKGKFDHWEVDAYYKREILLVLATAFPGKKALGGKGVFAIPTVSEYRSAYGA